MLSDVSTWFATHSSILSGKIADSSPSSLLNLFCTQSNGLALGAYVQGFYNLALEISKDQIQFLADLDYDYARVCEIQPRINLIRLNRAMINPDQLQLDTDLLLQAVANCKQLDPSMLPAVDAKALDDGTLINLAESTATIEAAKLAWAKGDMESCHDIASPLARDSATAMECSVRCLLEMGRIAEVIEIVFQNVERFPWLKAYAAIALLRGGALLEARRVIDSTSDVNFLPIMRVAVELFRCGLHDDCEVLMRRLLAYQLLHGPEAPLLVASSFCHSCHIEVPETTTLQINEIETRSRHFPSVLLHKVVFGSYNDFSANPLLNGLIHSASIRFLSCQKGDAAVGSVQQTVPEGRFLKRIREAYTSTKRAATELLSEIRHQNLLYA
ncbi:MAG: hypothetical protein VKN83_11625 [Cyanobacteriota bacterium]|nr:hypothetical protein [Cyanobacteriota bacterium]